MFLNFCLKTDYLKIVYAASEEYFIFKLDFINTYYKISSKTHFNFD